MLRLVKRIWPRRGVDAFVAKSAARARKRTVGDPFGEVEQGQQVSEEQFEKVLSYIDLWC